MVFPLPFHDFSFPKCLENSRLEIVATRSLLCSQVLRCVIYIILRGTLRPPPSIPSILYPWGAGLDIIEVYGLKSLGGLQCLRKDVDAGSGSGIAAIANNHRARTMGLVRRPQVE